MAALRIGANRVSLDDVACAAVGMTTQIIMTLTISQSVFELAGSHAYIRTGGREVFIQFAYGLPFRFFSKERQENGMLELWGFGMYAVAGRCVA